jgi:hypothetical protein
MACCSGAVRSSVIVVLVVCAVLAAIAAYFLPAQETAITREVRTEEFREAVGVVSPYVKELKDLKDFKDLNK